MGCNNSKTKKADKRKKEEAEAVAAAANAGSGGGASARDEARASESADAPAVAAAVPAAAAPSPLEGRQSADAAKGAAVDSADAADAEAAATSTSTAAESSSAVGADGELPESPADLSDTVIAEAHLADADEAPAAAAAAADAAVAAEPSRHASTPPATATDDVKEGHTTALYSSVSRTEPSPPPPPALQRDEATANSDVHFEMEDLDDDDAAAAGVAAQEVPPSQLRSTPRSPSPAPQPSPPPPAATPSEQETAATPVAMESAPQPTPKRDGSQPEATKRQRGSVAAASSTAASPHHRAPRAERLAALAASTRRRLSRRTSTAASSSLAERPPWRDAVSEESAAAPVEHPPAHQRGPAAPPAAAHRPPRFWSDDDVAVAAAAAALSPTASSAAASSEAPVMHEAVMPVGTPSERVAARRRRADLDRDVYTQPPAVELVRYRDSLGTIRTPRSQPPSLPASQPRRRGPAVSIPLRRGYTDPTPGAAAHEYRPTTTYLPPPTAFNKEAAGGAPPRLSLHPGVIAAIEASTTALVQAHRLPPHPAASGPVAGRLPASAADVAAYRDAVPLPPSHLCDGVYTATSIALATTESCSSHRSASDRPSPAAAAADQQPRHHDADAVSAGATREAGTYEPQYSNAHEPREGSVGAYEPSATDEAPTNSAVLPPVARRAGSGSADPRYPTSDDDVVEAWRHDAVDVTGGAAPALVAAVSPSQLHRRVQSWSPAEGSDGGDN
ncbi:hypothetical protein NESM_000209700 [Novymonas esmeraldas]|uniref:Uncharacterized protein n=1 Tax=Novymonas esmeraldas TaxID=1808958 RepID=A0AAW0F4F9_9TRYP